MGQQQQFAPSMRLEIRDAEWRLTRLDHASAGGYLLTCTDLSELVHGRKASFLSQLENEIRILDPVSTELRDDLSQGYRDGLLFWICSFLILPPQVTDSPRPSWSHGPPPFHVEPTRQALNQS